MSDLSSDTLKQIEAAIRSRHNGRKLLRPADADTITLEQSLSRLPSFQADARGFFNAAVTLHPCTITADPRREDLVRELTEDDLAGGRGQEEASSFAESWYDMLQGMGVNVSVSTLPFDTAVPVMVASI